MEFEVGTSKNDKIEPILDCWPIKVEMKAEWLKDFITWRLEHTNCISMWFEDYFLSDFIFTKVKEKSPLIDIIGMHLRSFSFYNSITNSIQRSCKRNKMEVKINIQFQYFQWMISKIPSDFQSLTTLTVRSSHSSVNWKKKRRNREKK